VLSYVVVALAAGFPIVVALAWIFDVKAGRIERAPAARLRGLPLALVLIGIGAAAAAPGLLYFFVVRSPARTVSAPASIAVLPFVNMSSDKESDYFSDGITEELINALANVKGLRVTSRTAVFALRGKNLGIRELGDELKVGTLVEGSIRREGNALRISAQLINVTDGYHLWSNTYDRELKSIFAVEDEIARSIAAALCCKTSSMPYKPRKTPSWTLTSNQSIQGTSPASSILPSAMNSPTRPARTLRAPVWQILTPACPTRSRSYGRPKALSTRTVG